MRKTRESNEKCAFDISIQLPFYFTFIGPIIGAFGCWQESLALLSLFHLVENGSYIDAIKHSVLVKKEKKIQAKRVVVDCECWTLIFLARYLFDIMCTWAFS